MLDQLPMRMLELYEYCQLHDVTALNELSNAPEHIRAVVRDVELRTKLLKLLFWRTATKEA